MARKPGKGTSGKGTQRLFKGISETPLEVNGLVDKYIKFSYISVLKNQERGDKMRKIRKRIITLAISSLAFVTLANASQDGDCILLCDQSKLCNKSSEVVSNDTFLKCMNLDSLNDYSNKIENVCVPNYFSSVLMFTFSCSGK